MVCTWCRRRVDVVCLVLVFGRRLALVRHHTYGYITIFHLIESLVHPAIVQFFVQRVFTARRYASAVYAMALCPSVSVCLSMSVTIRCSTKMAKRRITQTKPYDSSGSLVF